MPRSARKESTTGYYHVMVRGINKEYIFNDEKGKLVYMALLLKQQTEGRLNISAWCMMNNHIHILIKASLNDMSKALKIINIKFSSYYNKQNQRVGPVFGDRFRSENIEDLSYLLCVIRYIHKNPTEAKLVEHISDYKWSSYQEFTGNPHYITSDQQIFIMTLFKNNFEYFKDFHQEEDHHDHLEMKDDKEKLKHEKCLLLLKSFYINNKLENVNQLINNKILFSELSSILINDLGLSIRKAASLLGVEYNSVSKSIALYNRTK